jgi:hypothetical protein
MRKFKPGDLVYDCYSGRTGIIMSDNSINRLSRSVQLKFDWFVEVHWISAEKKFSETFIPNAEYVLSNALKLVSKS